MSWLHALRERIDGVLHGPERDDELAEEIQHHISLEAQHQMALGCDATGAHRRALEQFGDPAHVMDASRDARATDSLENSVYDARLALRVLRKQSGFSLLAIVTLALGVGATTAAFTVVDTVLLRPLPYASPGQLVALRERNRTGELQPSSYPNFADWRARAKSFNGVVAEQYPWSQTVTIGSDVSRATIMGVSRGFFATIGVKPIVGREIAPNENRPGGAIAVMVSYEFWQTHMNHRQPLGTIASGDNVVPVVGVLPRGFRLMDDADVYFPLEVFPGTCRSCRNYRVFARLAPGATLASAQAEMTALSHALLATYRNETSAADVGLIPLRDYIVGRYNRLLTVVLAGALVVLLIACTNLVGAQLARGLTRGRDVGIRAALGASRGRLIRQMLIESGVLALAGAVAGVLFAIMCTDLVRTFGAGLLPRLDDLRVDGTVILVAAGLTVLVALIIGLYPALRLARGAPGHLLQGARGSTATVRDSAWRMLIGFEMAAAMVLLAGSALLIRTMHNIATADTGFEPRGIITASMVPDDTVDMAKLATLREQLASIPGVTGVAFANHEPLDWGGTSGPVRRPTDPADHDYPAMAGFRLVSPGYFGVMRQPVLRGRPIGDEDRAGSPPVAVVTTGIAQTLWPGQNPIGQHIITNYLFGQPLTVVGVVAEADLWSSPRGAQNEIYVPLAQHPTKTEGQFVAFLRASRDPAAVMSEVRGKLHEIAPANPPDMGLLEDRITDSAADRRFATFALTLFGAVALVLAGVGIYGTMSYMVAARTHELGVRLALGATPAQVRLAALSEAARMSFAGIGVGIVAGLFASRVVHSILFGVSRMDPTAYLAGVAVLLAAAIAGAYLPARRSSRVDPLEALRAEQ